MNPHRALNWTLATLIAVVMSTAYMLDGPDDMQAARDTAASVADAQAAAAQDSIDIRATRTAQVQP